MKDIVQLRTVLILLIAAGLFPRQAHAVIALAADLVGIIGTVLNGQGINIEQRSIETVGVLVLILVIISILSTSVGRTMKRGRNAHDRG